MGLDRILGYPHLRRNLPLRHSLDPAKDEGLAGLEGHRRDRPGQLAQFVPVYRVLLGRGRVVEMLEPFQVVDGVDRNDSRATDVTHDDRARDLEQIGARVTDGVHGLQLG
jgi:hypothetical protein